MFEWILNLRVEFNKKPHVLFTLGDGRNMRRGWRQGEKDPASLNLTSNAGKKERHYTHTIKGRGAGLGFDELGMLY